MISMENAGPRRMTERLLLCTDLDRTVLPNGTQPESPDARERFGILAMRPEVTLAYVTGRHRMLVEKALACYSLPRPDYVVGDVGTTIYELSLEGWDSWADWQAEIGPDWAGLHRADLQEMFSDLTSLRLQEATKQNRFKLSYYVPLDVDREATTREMQIRLDGHGVHASLIWSVDEPAGIGLLDVLPASATKLHAVEFLMLRKGFLQAETVFAGDSGNDLPVLTSPLQSILVANAAAEVREEAVRLAAEKGTRKALYLARGDFAGMNGNYSAGILEGLAHYLPETEDWWK